MDAGPPNIALPLLPTPASNIPLRRYCLNLSLASVTHFPADQESADASLTRDLAIPANVIHLLYDTSNTGDRATPNSNRFPDATFRSNMANSRLLVPEIAERCEQISKRG